MKNFIFNLILFSAISYQVFSQVYFSLPVRLTNGNNDRNPSFGTSRNSFTIQNFQWEFMVFERVESNSSHICVTKIGDSGSVSSDFYITNDSFNNINPSISYGRNNIGFGIIIKYAVIVWQSNKFGRQSIFMSTYKSTSGWTNPKILDSSGIDNTTPEVCSIDSINYSIVYKSGTDIMYKKYNINTNNFSNETNLTLTEPDNCFNPKLKYFRDNFLNPKIWISYEKEISLNRKGIFFTSGSIDSTPVPAGINDTISITGNNRNLGFGNDQLTPFVIFESDRNGSNINIYGTSVLQLIQNSILSDNKNDILNYTGGDFAITDNYGNQNYLYSYIERSMTGLQLLIKFNLWIGSLSSHKISSNPDYQTNISLNNSIRVGNYSCERHWFVYNKDSLSPSYPSTIYGVYFTNCLSEINSNVKYNPGNFYLSQNYPNPFNPSTKINYELRINNYEFVSLKIFDALGREAAVLVNQKQNAGKYEVEFDGSGFPSGVYYYKLEAGSLSEVRKMILLK